MSLSIYGHTFKNNCFLKSPVVFIKSFSSGVTQYVMTVLCILIKSDISDLTLLRL